MGKLKVYYLKFTGGSIRFLSIGIGFLYEVFEELFNSS